MTQKQFKLLIIVNGIFMLLVIFFVGFFYPVQEKHSGVNNTITSEITYGSDNLLAPSVSSRFAADAVVSTDGDTVMFYSEVLKAENFYYQAGFFQGQRHALSGKIRVKLDNNGIYQWTSWEDDETKLIYTPDKKDSEEPIN
jgi:hypothetical protein